MWSYNRPHAGAGPGIGVDHRSGRAGSCTPGAQSTRTAHAAGPALARRRDARRTRRPPVGRAPRVRPEDGPRPRLPAARDPAVGPDRRQRRTLRQRGLPPGAAPRHHRCRCRRRPPAPRPRTPRRRASRQRRLRPGRRPPVVAWRSRATRYHNSRGDHTRMAARASPTRARAPPLRRGGGGIPAERSGSSSGT